MRGFDFASLAQSAGYGRISIANVLLTVPFFSWQAAFPAASPGSEHRRLKRAALDICPSSGRKLSGNCAFKFIYVCFNVLYFCHNFLMLDMPLSSLCLGVLTARRKSCSSSGPGLLCQLFGFGWLVLILLLLL